MLAGMSVNVSRLEPKTLSVLNWIFNERCLTLSGKVDDFRFQRSSMRLHRSLTGRGPFTEATINVSGSDHVFSIDRFLTGHEKKSLAIFAFWRRSCIYRDTHHIHTDNAGIVYKG